MERPEWVREPVQTLDARAMIASGDHPFSRVMGGLDALNPGEVYLLVTPFVPAPLVNAAKEKGFAAWSDSSEAEEVKTWFTKAF